MKYSVGPVKVKIVEIGPNSYQYVVDDDPIRKYEELIHEKIEEILYSIPESTSINSLDVIEVAKKVLGIKDSDSLIAYAIMREVKYRKLQVLLDDPYVEDISVVGPGPVWVRHSVVVSKDPKADFIPTNIVIEDSSELLSYMNIVAEKAGKVLTKAVPILDFNLPEKDGGHRVHIVLPEIAGGSGELVIRKKKSSAVLGIKELIKSGMLNEAIASLIQYVIEHRGSILIVGPPGAGKTTLLRAILYDLIPRSWKIAIIEDTPEIDPPKGSSWVRYVVPVSPWGSDGGIDQMALAKAALRSSVSRFLVIGETRGAEAKVLVQAMNMGLGGLTTFHGGNAEEAILRLTSPPISLTPSQVSMFWLIITVSYVVNGGIKRAVVSIDEPIYSREDDVVYINNIYTYDEEVSFDELISRCRKIRKKVVKEAEVSVHVA